MSRPTQALISQGALLHNLQVVRASAPRSRVMAVVKADAYGHGAVRVVGILERAGVDALAVASLEEGLQLRESGISAPVFILEGPFTPDEIPAAAHHRLGLVLHCFEQLAWLSRTDLESRLEVFLKLDSGMHRLGFAPCDLFAALAALRACPGVHLRGLMSHLARADEPENRYNNHQFETFFHTFEKLADQGLERSLAASAAILRNPDTHLDWVRPGLMLYGMSPFAEVFGPALGLMPVLQLRSALMAVRELQPGDWLGYGAAFQADRRMRVGVVAIGYGDGYPRQLGNGTPVLVGGRRSRLLGRVSMDMLFVDLSELPTAKPGDEVVLMGHQGSEQVTAEELALLAGTIPYELTCRIQGRVPRILES